MLLVWKKLIKPKNHSRTFVELLSYEDLNILTSSIKGILKIMTLFSIDTVSENTS